MGFTQAHLKVVAHIRQPSNILYAYLLTYFIIIIIVIFYNSAFTSPHHKFKELPD